MKPPYNPFMISPSHSVLVAWGSNGGPAARHRPWSAEEVAGVEGDDLTVGTDSRLGEAGALRRHSGGKAPRRSGGRQGRAAVFPPVSLHAFVGSGRQA